MEDSGECAKVHDWDYDGACKQLFGESHYNEDMGLCECSEGASYKNRAEVKEFYEMMLGDVRRL